MAREDETEKDILEYAGVEEDDGGETGSEGETHQEETPSGAPAERGTAQTRETHSQPQQGQQPKGDGATQGQQPGQQQQVTQQQPAQQQPPQTKKQLSAALLRQGGMGYDDSGNIVNSKGELVAVAGQERRMFEDAIVRMRTFDQYERPRYEQQVQELTNQLAQANVLNGLPKSYGLNDDQTQWAIKLAASYARDPIATIKYVLTEAKAAGHNIDQLFDGQTISSIDTDAISRMIDQRLQPFTSQHQQEEAARQAQQAAQQQYGEFVSRYPDAELHANEIAALWNRLPSNSSVVEAYFQLKSWVSENGFDWNQPLRPQIEQAMAGQGGNQQPHQQQQQPTQQQRRPMTGRGTHGEPVQSQAAPSMSRSDASFDEIIREAMSENG